jgi:hypothetical protein
LVIITSFFANGERFLFKPETVTSLYSQETPMEEAEKVEVVETKNIRQSSAPRGRREVLKKGH